MKRFLILGSGGLVGSRFIELIASERLSIAPRSYELDITDKGSISTFFKQRADDFDVVVNFAAVTDVDAAEKERGEGRAMTWRVNTEGAANVAWAVQKYEKFLIHISTDFVFPGTKSNPGPYTEEAKLPNDPKNINWYGWTKLWGERKVGEICERSAIVRISYPFRAHYTEKLDFARKILLLFDQGKLYPMFSDQIITPTFIDEAVNVIEKIGEIERAGVYHLASANTTTPYDFANYLLEKARGVKGVVREGFLEEFLKVPGRTPRPIYGGLDTKKTQSILGVRFKTWQKAIDEFVRQIESI